MSPFLASIFRFLILGLAWPALTWAQSSLSVNASQSVRTVDERVFGLNAVVWDGNTGTAQTVSLLQAAGVRAIRIPGGSLSDEYHWLSHAIQSTGQNWPIGFPTFTNLITGLNAQTFVTVNYGSGTPEEAAAWVAYANASASLLGTGADVTIGVDSKGFDWKTVGYWSALRNSAPLGTDDGRNFLRISRASPFGLKYWEIGNECYGAGWEYDIQAVRHDPYTYAVRSKDYIAKMKAADPTIKIGVVGVTGETAYANNTNHPTTNPRTGLVRNGWTPVLLTTLKNLGFAPDYLIYHRYEQAPAADQPGNPETDAGLLQKAKTWPQDATDLRQQLTDYLSGTGAGVELIVTENNSVYAKPGKQTTSLVNGLYYADSIGNILQTEFNALVWWDLRNSQENVNNNDATLYGWRNYGDYGILSSVSGFGSATAYDPYPTYYAFKLLSYFARGGDTVISAASNNTLLTLFAVKRTNGALSLLVINKDPTNTLGANIALTGFTPGSSATTYTYGKPQDTAAQLGSGSTNIATGSMSVSGSAFAASFAPYSLTVISLDAAAATVAPTITAHPENQMVNAGGAALFTASASGTPTPSLQWQRLPAGSGTWANVSEGGSYSGSTTTTLTVSNTVAGMSGDLFRGVATNSTGSATSNAAALTVIVAPSNAIITIMVE